MQDAGGVKAREILSVLAIGELAMVALFAPAFTAASLTLEKERKTLESLFATALRPWEIATGKMVGSLAFLLMVVLSGAPALAAPLLLGGISLTEVLAVLGLLLLTAVYLGAIGLFISTIMHRSYRSIIATYAVLLVVFFLFATPAWPISSNLISRCGPTTQAILHVLCSFSPLEAMISLVLAGSGYAVGARGMPPFWVMFVPIALATTCVLAVACVLKLRRPIAPPRSREKLKVIERGKFTARSVMFLVDPRKRKRMIRWWQNPVLIKEFRSRPLLQAHRLIRSALTCLIVSFLLMLAVNVSVSSLVGEQGTRAAAGGGTETLAMIPAIATAVSVLMIVMIILIGPAMSAGAISSDRETGVWELLRTTRLSSWRIASGKFQASIIPLLLMVAAILPSLAVLLYIDPTVLPNVLRVLAVVGSTIFFVSSAGMFFSSLFARTSTATAWTYGVVISLGLATLLMLLGDEAFSAGLVRPILLVNPVAAVMEAAGSSVMQKYSLLGDHLRIMLTAGAALCVLTVVRVFQLRRPE